MTRIQSLYVALFLIGVLCFSSVNAQNSEVIKGSLVMKAEFLGLQSFGSQPEFEDWNPMLKNIFVVHTPGADVDADEFRRIKAEADKTFYSSTQEEIPQQKTAVATSPIVDNNWLGNQYSNSIPNDNHVAVSNGGIVMSVSNTTIRVYQDANNVSNPSIYSRSLASFLQGALGSNNDIKYDPRVIYDPKRDRFIVVYLVGATDATSKIPIAFSKTNDPRDGFNLYIITGNPNNDGNWTDYPQIGITDEELFITGNLFSNAGNSRYSLIWQVNKNQGYAGDTTLDYRTFQTAQGHFSPCPVIYGNTTRGPQMFFVSTVSRPSAPSGTIRLHMIDNTIAAGGVLTTRTVTATTLYRPAASADQPGTAARNLNTNDCRVQCAFYENDKIQFVMPTGNNVSRPSVYHGVIHDVLGTPSVQGQIISSSTLLLGFPSIAYVGNSPTDNSSIITMLHVSNTVNPGTSALYVDSTFTPSDLVTVKTGDGVMNTGIDGTTPTERWGDYIGLAKYFPQGNVVFTAGSYGQSSSDPGTWIAKIYAPNWWGVKNNPDIAEKAEIKMFPNPASEQVLVEFNLPVTETGFYTAKLYDIEGRLVKEIVRNQLKEGIARISFNTSHLNNGVYILKLEDGDKAIWQDKLVIQK
jgi:hypothetical protein